MHGHKNHGEQRLRKDTAMYGVKHHILVPVYSRQAESNRFWSRLYSTEARRSIAAASISLPDFL
jgi:hypothetical protein